MFGSPEEYLYLHYLCRWERTAPDDRRWGQLDDKRAQNTQTARMVKVLQMLTGLNDRPLRKLAKHTERKDGRSYISKDSSWMEEPYELGKGWYFNGCMSLADKSKILHSLPQMGLSSREFAKCAQDFVEGQSVEKYWPSAQEAARQIEQWKKADR
jgi:hypothetical protein